jgi:hypothetical protein
MASAQYRCTGFLKQVMPGLSYLIFLDSHKILGRYAKNWIFPQNKFLQYYFSKSVHMVGYLTMRCVKYRVKSSVLPDF